MHHTNTTNDFWIRVNQGSDNRHLKITQSFGNVEINGTSIKYLVMVLVLLLRMMVQMSLVVNMKF